MIFHLSRSCRIIFNNLKNVQNIFIYKGLCNGNSIIQPKKFRINLGIYQKRNYHGFWRKPSIDELKVQDDVPGDYKLIYRNKMDNYLWYIQIITSTTAVIMGLKLMSDEGLHFKAPLPEKLNDQTFKESDTFILLSFLIVAIVLLQTLLFKMPIRIYNCPQSKKYKLVFYGNMPFTQKTFSCKAGELIEFPGRISPWKDIQYLLDSNEKRAIYLFEQYFHRSADLYIMMGLQDDPDFENNKEQENSNK